MPTDEADGAGFPDKEDPENTPTFRPPSLTIPIVTVPDATGTDSEECTYIWRCGSKTGRGSGSPTFYPGNETTGYNPGNDTRPDITSNYTQPTLPPAVPSTCIEPKEGETITEYSIIYTDTVTFYGNRSDYTPPYPTIETPDYCTSHPNVSHTPPPTGTPVKTDPEEFTTGKVPGTTCSGAKCVAFSPPGWEPISSTEEKHRTGSKFSTTRVTVTFVTTDKNPSVIYPSDPVPRFSKPGHDGMGVTPGGQGEHRPPEGDGGTFRDPQSMEGVPQGGPPARPTFVITAGSGQVIINDQTFSSLQPGATTTVTVDDGTFTIEPTAVIGEGATVLKPEPQGTAVSVIQPTSTMVGGLPVVLTGSEVIIDGSTFTIPPAGTTTEVSDETVSIGAGKVVVGGQTLTFEASGGAQSDVVVAGGEMITAAGQSVYVFRQTTITYGPGISETTEVVDDDTITIGPSGIIVHGKTLGGTAAETSETSFEIVGGATITRLSPSFVIIDDTTFTVGPGATSTTKEIGGETVSIGPSGVTISTLTLTYPFGPTTVTTIKPSATGTDGLPIETDASDNRNNDADGDEDDDSAGTPIRPSLTAGFTGLCIAIGVLFWI